MDDVREAADAFRPIYEETAGADGFVSIEVSPTLANDTEGTPVQMDCQGGVCTCFTGDEGTDQVAEDVRSEADAKSVYFAACRCL